MAYAVATARRAWLTADDIANTRGWAQFKKLLKAEPRFLCLSPIAVQSQEALVQVSS